MNERLSDSRESNEQVNPVTKLLKMIFGKYLDKIQAFFSATGASKQVEEVNKDVLEQYDPQKFANQVDFVGDSNAQACFSKLKGGAGKFVEKLFKVGASSVAINRYPFQKYLSPTAKAVVVFAGVNEHAWKKPLPDLLTNLDNIFSKIPQDKKIIYSLLPAHGSKDQVVKIKAFNEKLAAALKEKYGDRVRIYDNSKDNPDNELHPPADQMLTRIYSENKDIFA